MSDADEGQGRDTDVEAVARGADEHGHNWRAALRSLASEPLPPKLRRALVELGVYGYRLRGAVRAYDARVLRSMRDPEEREQPVSACRAWLESAEREAALRAYTEAREAVSAMSRAWVEGLTAAADPVLALCSCGWDGSPAALVTVSGDPDRAYCPACRELFYTRAGAKENDARLTIIPPGGEPQPSDEAVLRQVCMATIAQTEGAIFALAVADELQGRDADASRAIRLDVVAAGDVSLPLAREIVARYFSVSLQHLSPALLATLRAGS